MPKTSPSAAGASSGRRSTLHAQLAVLALDQEARMPREGRAHVARQRALEARGGSCP
jgi:hypothetical protein